MLVYDTRLGVDAPVQTIHSMQKGKIRSLAARNNLVVTCGMSEAEPPGYRNRYQTQLMDEDGETPDLFVNIADTRMIQVRRLFFSCVCVWVLLFFRLFFSSFCWFVSLSSLARC